MDCATAPPEEHTAGEQEPEEVPPAAVLQLPADWFNVLEDGDDVVAARRRYDSVLERVFPAMEPRAREQGVEGLLAWREKIWTAGFLTHGILAAPPTDDSGPLLWQILVTLVKVPELSREIDPGAMLARLMEKEIEGALHVEHFETKLGSGAGMIAHTPLDPDMGQLQLPYTVSGTAAAISCSQGGGWSILVMGNSYDPDQVTQLGWLVGQIAGHSTLEEQQESQEPSEEKSREKGHA